MQQKKGFTLIELLVVIAILGILIAILIPNLLKARDKAHNVAAVSCAHEFLIQGTIYVVDHNSYEGFDGKAPYDSRSCARGVESYQLDTVDKNLLEGRIISLAGTAFRFSTQTGVTQAQ